MAESADLQKLMVLIEANTRSYERAMAKVQQQTDRAMKRSAASTDRVNNSLRRIEASALLATTRLMAMAGVVGPGSALILGMRTISEASDLAKVADKVGLGVEALQRLRFGFELTGVAANQTDVAMQRFSRRIGEAANGGGELFKIIEANNIALRNQDGSMRSQVDILRDYANLIKTAGSEQEALLLAFKAFDTEGAGLVNALKGGADGLDTLMAKADQAGGVLEESLVRKAEEIDDEFASLWRKFEIRAKSSILTAASFLSDMRDGINGLSIAAGDLREALGGSFSELARIERAFFTANQRMTERHIDLADQLVRKFGGTRTATSIIPSSSSSNAPIDRAARAREAEQRAIERQQQAIAEYIESLRYENDLMRMTSVERAKAVAVRGLDASATADQVAEVERLAVANYELETSLQAVALAQDFIGRHAMDAFDRIVEGTFNARDALAELMKDLARMMAQRTIMQLLGMAFGAPAGGSLPFDLLRRPMAGGGAVDAGLPRMIGERGPELFVPRSAGAIVPNHALKSAAPSMNFAPNITVHGASGSPDETARAIRRELDGFARKEMPRLVRRYTGDPLLGSA